MGMMIVGKPEEDRPLRNGRLDGRNAHPKFYLCYIKFWGYISPSQTKIKFA
jgi:hypothetical protein